MCLAGKESYSSLTAGVYYLIMFNVYVKATLIPAF